MDGFKKKVLLNDDLIISKHTFLDFFLFELKVEGPKIIKLNPPKC